MQISSPELIRFSEALSREVLRLPKYSSKYSRKDYTIRQHVVLLCLKIKLKKRYREFCGILVLMPEIMEMLGLEKVPHWTTLDKAFLRLGNSVLMILVYTESSSFSTIDATGFDRRHASTQYLSRCQMHIKSMKTTFLVDVVTQEIIDIHCTTTRKHDSKIVLPLTKHHRLKMLCGDMGYDDCKVRRTLRNRGVRPIILHREFMDKQKYWNSLIDKNLYHKRSISETVNSVIKRRYSDTLYSKNWRSQFLELTLLAIVYNTDRKIRVLLEVFYKAFSILILFRTSLFRRGF